MKNSQSVSIDLTSGRPKYTAPDVNKEMPKDYIIWSLLSLLYGNCCCLGLAAFVNSIKARDRKMVGDMEGTRSYGSSARMLNIIATVIVCLLFLITVVAYATVWSHGGHVVNSTSTEGNSHYLSG